MNRPSSIDVLRIWEDGMGQGPLDRALSMLSAVFPGAGRDQLAELNVQRRDQLLLELRESLFGRQLKIRTQCQACSTDLECSVGTNQIARLDHDEGDLTDQVHEFRHADLTILFRLPTSADLAAVLEHDVDTAETLLLQRCIIEMARDDTPVAPSTIDDGIRGQLMQRMGEHAAGADIVMDFQCPTCGSAYQESLDIGSFLWAEINTYARRLLQEVHVIAKAYGWAERDILAMSSARRNMYLDMVVA